MSCFHSTSNPTRLPHAALAYPIVIDCKYYFKLYSTVKPGCHRITSGGHCSLTLQRVFTRQFKEKQEAVNVGLYESDNNPPLNLAVETGRGFQTLFNHPKSTSSGAFRDNRMTSSKLFFCHTASNMPYGIFSQKLSFPPSPETSLQRLHRHSLPREERREDVTNACTNNPFDLWRV